MSIEPRMPEQAYVYYARCVYVVDGDTIDVHVDQGFHTFRKERLRLLGVNTPERKGETRPEGEAAKDYTVEWLLQALTGPLWEHSDDEDDWPLLIETEKSDAFGRYLATVWNAETGACLNHELVMSGNAVVDIR